MQYNYESIQNQINEGNIEPYMDNSQKMRDQATKAVENFETVSR